MTDLLQFAATTEARWVRPRTFRVDHVDLAVTIDPLDRTVEGVVIHTCTWIAGARGEVAFDQHGLDLTAVAVDDQPVTWSQSATEVRIPVTASGSFRVRLAFRAPAPAKGIYHVAPAADRVSMSWTQGAMEDHAHWFPCYDSPNNLSTYRIAIRHRAAFQALAGGVCTGREESAPDATGIAWATTTYVQDRPHVLYLVNVVVGDFVPVADEAAPVPVTHWLPRGREACGPAVFRATAFAIRELAQFIGVPYPWQRYGHVVVHRFLWGGMENTTLTTISDRVLATAAEQQREDVDADSLVIHELVHQWFGDLLTMKGWSDIWLNESFATYLEARITARWRAAQGVASEADALAHELWRNRSAYLDQHDGRYRRALVTNRWDDAYELFDRVAYEQGSLVLHTLASWLGEARFHAALKLYTSRHAHDVVETADFRQAIEDATGEPADWFFDQWVFRPGHPALTVTWTHSPARQQVVVIITQAEPCSRLHLTVAAAGLPEQQVDITGPSHAVILAAPTAPAWVAVDPRGEVLATISEEAVQPALIADSQAPAHARARACATAGSKHPAPALRAAVIAAAGPASPALVREQAIEALAAWRLAEPLLTLYPQLSERERRVVVAALGRFRDAPEAAAIATQLVTWADVTASDATAGDCLAARGALEIPGAAPLLRARLGKPGWNHRRLAGAVRGFGACAEPAALDEVLRLAADTSIPDPVLPLVASAIGSLGARLPLARERCRRVLAQLVAHDLMTVRVAAAKGIATLGDPAARAALSTQRAREGFGNVRRVLREALHALDQVAATTTATVELTRRISDLEGARTKLEQRLAAIEKQIAAPG